MNKVQVIIIAFSIIIVIAAIIIFSFMSSGEPPRIGDGTSQLVVWGVDRKEIFQSLFETYEREFKVKIEYEVKNPRTFRQDIIEALASEKNPDLVIASADWIVANRERLAPLPSSTATPEDIENIFARIVADTFIETVTAQQKPQRVVWALPLWIDPLVLYWNKDIFAEVRRAVPPPDWTEFIKASNDIRKLGQSDVVVRAGSALGRASNIPLYKEIFSLLLLQENADLEASLQKTSYQQEMESVIRFYSDFGNASKARSGVYTWNTRIAEPRALFTEGKLGMMLDYHSYKSFLAEKNTHISFGVALAPQIENAKTPVHFADVHAIAVLRRSQGQKTAWHFAQWLTSQAQAAIYLPRVGAAPARRDLIQASVLSPLLQESALNARRTKENYPEYNSDFLRDIIESVADGRLTPSESLAETRARYRGLLEQQ